MRVSGQRQLVVHCATHSRHGGLQGCFGLQAGHSRLPVPLVLRYNRANLAYVVLFQLKTSCIGIYPAALVSF